MSQSIKVVVRVRPMSSKEQQANCKSIVEVVEEHSQISIQKPSEPDAVKTFAFDAVFADSCPQPLVYEKAAYKLVESVIEGYNGTIFAYGQTGCGKTHSMVGKLDQQHLHGLIPRSFTHVLKVAAECQDSKQFLVRCSFIEIYNEEVHDLLSENTKTKLDVKESPDKGIFIKDLSVKTAKTYDELMHCMEIGNSNRSVGQTLMNKDSSRSHSMFTLNLQFMEKGPQGQDRYVASKLNLVDLAGSERICKTGVTGDRLKQAQKINLSLSALGNVISALVDGKSQHVPYRDSKLTRLLQDSLGGNTKTVMVANVSPADYNYDQTLSTLRYASRAKFIKNKPIINEDPKDALLKQYADEIKKLKSMLGNDQSTMVMRMETPSFGQTITLENELRVKEEEIEEERRKRAELQERIRQLEGQTVVGKEAHIQLDEAREIEEAREHIRMSDSKKASRYHRCSTFHEEAVYQNKSANQQIEVLKRNNKKYTEKIRKLQSEIDQVNRQTYADKEVLVDQIRCLEQESKTNQAILQMLLSMQEIEKLRTAAQFSEDKDCYEFPSIYFKIKRPSLPKLQLVQDAEGSQVLRRVSLQSVLKVQRMDTTVSRDSYCLNNIIKQARDHQQWVVSRPERVNRNQLNSMPRPR